MKTVFTALVTVGLWTAAAMPDTSYRDAARDLRKMVGYTIVQASTVQKVYESSGSSKIIKLANGQSFKVDYMFLSPLTLTDVIVFSKPYPKELVDKYKDTLPANLLSSYKLLVDNEAFDATPQ